MYSLCVFVQFSIFPYGICLFYAFIHYNLCIPSIDSHGYIIIYTILQPPPSYAPMDNF